MHSLFVQLPLRLCEAAGPHRVLSYRSAKYFGSTDMHMNTNSVIISVSVFVFLRAFIAITLFLGHDFGYEEASGTDVHS